MHSAARLPGQASLQFRGRKLCFASEGARTRDRGRAAPSVRDRVAPRTPLGDAAAVAGAVRRVGRVVYIASENEAVTKVACLTWQPPSGGWQHSIVCAIWAAQADARGIQRGEESVCITWERPCEPQLSTDTGRTPERGLLIFRPGSEPVACAQPMHFTVN